jgi:hypothetical protein
MHALPYNLRDFVKKTNLCEVEIRGVASDGAVWIAVSGVANELRVPHSEIVFAVRSRWEDGHSRSTAGNS